MSPSSHTLSDLRERVVARLRGRGLNEHDAQDCAQNALLAMHRALARRPDHGDPEALAFAIEKTAYVDWLRRHGPKRRRSEAEVVERAAPREVVHVDLDPALDLRAAVAALPERLRVVVELSVRRGLSYPEIAEALSIPVGTVKSRMHAAVRRLRAELGHEGGAR